MSNEEMNKVIKAQIEAEEQYWKERSEKELSSFIVVGVLVVLLAIALGIGNLNYLTI